MSDRKMIPFTNEHFAAFCEQMIGQPYWFGTCGYKATTSLLKRKTEQYPSHYGSSRTSQYKQDIANRAVVCDCIGAAKQSGWQYVGVYSEMLTPSLIQMHPKCTQIAP